jgi:outer membrane protein
MMNRVAVLAAGAVVVACASDAGAARRRAYVDYQRALVTVCEGRAAKAALRREFDEKQSTLDSRASDLAASRAKFEIERAAMSDGERRARQAELQRRETELQSVLEGLQKDLAEHERIATRKIFDRMSPISREVSTEFGYDRLVEGKGQGPRGTHDITDELVARYDLRFPAECPAPKAPTSRTAVTNGAARSSDR